MQAVAYTCGSEVISEFGGYTIPLGSEGTTASAQDLMLSAIAGSLAITIDDYLKANNLPTEGLSIDVHLEQPSSIQVRVTPPKRLNPSEAKTALLVAKRDPLLCLLRGEMDMELTSPKESVGYVKKVGLQAA